MYYINCKEHGVVETIDQFESRKEARLMLREYAIAFQGYGNCYISTRSTKEWRSQNENNL